MYVPDIAQGCGLSRTVSYLTLNSQRLHLLHLPVEWLRWLSPSHPIPRHAADFKKRGHLRNCPQGLLPEVSSDKVIWSWTGGRRHVLKPVDKTFKELHPLVNGRGFLAGKSDLLLQPQQVRFRRAK